ncbi:hypothetical protein BRARA_I04588 [Brassica rapa]|uniref:Uncharacterized protein n=1 Tax=Brassica campestris TaxID=3711 RepID=A0A397Y361_BRACM|nr:hypothetical protein BRARA_I04588 [Brassica rapa]
MNTTGHSHINSPYAATIFTNKGKKHISSQFFYRILCLRYLGMSLDKCTSLSLITEEYVLPPSPWHQQLQKSLREFYLPD